MQKVAELYFYLSESGVPAPDTAAADKKEFGLSRLGNCTELYGPLLFSTFSGVVTARGIIEDKIK